MLAREDLRPYQGRASTFIKENLNCALFVEPGLGKTVSTLTAIRELQERFEVAKVLVIGPLRVAARVWGAEVETWAHLLGMKVAKAVGTAAQRAAALAADVDIVTLGRENCQWLEEHYITGKKQTRVWPFDLVVLDEMQSWKSRSSFRWKAIRRLRRLFPRCVGLTGTPAPNGLLDLWAPLFLLDGGMRLGTTERAFKERWFDQSGYEGYSWTPKPHAAAEIQAAISDIVLTMRAEDFLSLPPVIYNTIKVQLPEGAREKYKALATKYIFETYAGRTVTAVNAAVCRGKLLQLANGSIYVDDQGNYEPLHDAKLDALVEVLEGLNPPVLIAYSFRADLERIMARLKKSMPGKRVEVLKDDASFDRLRRGEIDYGVLHPASAGHGLNDLYISGCTNIIWPGVTANLEHYLQLNARLTGGHRRTGRNIVVHHILAEDTVDEDTYSLLTRKDATQDDLTRSMANIARSH